MDSERTISAESAVSDIHSEQRAAISSRLRAWIDQLAAAIVAARVDIAIVTGITLLAAVLRIWSVGSIPDGLHGDEAWTGLDARRVLEEGWIGPYVGSALGQPTGPLYFTALLFTFLPETTFTLRLSMALFGVVTIPIAYLAFSTMFNRTVAAYGALLLAVMMWHLHLSRIAYMVIAWPFAEVLTLWLLWLGMRHLNLWLMGAAGVVFGLGLYTYNAYPVFVPVPFVALAWSFVRLPEWRERKRLLLGAGLFAAVALVVVTPFLDYVNDNTEFYRSHQRTVSLVDSPAWKDADTSGRFDLLWDRFRDWETGVVNPVQPDFADGLASKGHPLIDPVVVVLAVGGLGFALWNWRKPAYATLIAAVIFIPLGALLTVDAGAYRRTFGLAPFAAVLAAIPLAWLWERLWQRRDDVKYVYLLAVLGIVAFIGARTTYLYFGPVQETNAVEYTFPYQLEPAAEYMDELPDDTFIYFYSGRWSIDYETVRFVAPGLQGENRSKEFRPEAGQRQDERVNLTVDREGPVAFVFLAPYLEHADDVAARYPGGTMTQKTRGDEVLFRAYYLPEGAGD